MDENHQDKTESKTPATEDKLGLPVLSSKDQTGTDRLQNNQMENTIKHLRDSGYKVTEEYSNTGQLSKVSGEHPQRKTTWDWLQLLIIPLLIFLLGIGFTWVQNQTSLQIAKDNRSQDLKIADDQQQEATLKAYLDDMTTLLLDKKLGSQSVADKAASDEAAVIARAKTLTALRRLTDPRRKAVVVQFLYEAHLIGYPSPAHPSSLIPVASIIELVDADLSRADLSRADLRGADLSYATLSGANLSGAFLIGATLSYATLSYATLSGADLSGADLSGASLLHAQVTNEQLAQAKSLKGAILPDGKIHP